MNWADAAIISTAIMGVVNIIDSHLVTKRVPSFKAFLVLAGILSAVNGAVLFGLFPLPHDIGATVLLITIASGILRALGVLLILHILQTGEVSRIIPVVHSHPVFVAILAVLLLGETLVHLQWIAIIITVAGAMLISFQRGSRIGIGRVLAKPLLASLLLAAANITSKYALDHIYHWSMLAVGMLAVGFTFLGIALRPRALRELRQLRRPLLTLGLLAVNGILVIIGLVLLFWSIANGPVSLVSALSGTRPAFVFIYALILGRISTVLLEQRMGRETIALRSVAITMIIGGIAIIHLA